MRIVNGVGMLAAALVIAACGGGGGDAGTNSFGSGGGTSSGGGGTGGTGGTGGSGTGGGSTTPTTPGGGISTVANGVPSQRFMSISAEVYNLDWSFDGKTTTIQVFAADTAGNPVPDGTTVQFSTEGGQIQTSCKTTGIASGTSVISGCSVTFNTQDYRPLDGLVRIIAWMEGEEAYRDLNANGRYDAGEPFVDSGQIFRDDDDSATYSADQDELVVDATLTGQPGIGTSTCGAPSQPVNINETPLSVDGTCDGAWGRTLIRRTIVLPVSDPRFLAVATVSGSVVADSRFAGVLAPVSEGVTVFTALPSPPFSSPPIAAAEGTTVTVPNPPAGCTVSVSPPTVGTAQIGPSFHAIEGQGSATDPGACSGQTVLVEAKFGSVSSATTFYTFP